MASGGGAGHSWLLLSSLKCSLIIVSLPILSDHHVLGAHCGWLPLQASQVADGHLGFHLHCMVCFQVSRIPVCCVLVGRSVGSMAVCRALSVFLLPHSAVWIGFDLIFVSPRHKTALDTKPGIELG